MTFAAFGIMICLVAQSPDAVTTDVVHAYLNGDGVVHYSLESGSRAFVRRATCTLGAGELQCRLARLPTYYRLPEKVDYPVRIKEVNTFCWSLFPGEPYIKPGGLPHSPRLAPTPEFACTRMAPNNFHETPVRWEVIDRINWNDALADKDLERRQAKDDPIQAMFKSRFIHIDDHHGMALGADPFPAPYQLEPGQTTRPDQTEFVRFGSYDILPSPDGGCSLLLVMEGSENRRYIMPPSQKRRMYELATIPTAKMPRLWSWRVIDHYPSEFVDRFIAVDSNGARWFVTGKGELYRCVSDGTEKSIRKVARRDDQPIQALFEEPGAPSRCFAFTSTNWFELKQPFEYHDFALPTLDREKPLSTLLEAARELLKLYPAPVN
jgi:hypothetical protein